MSPYVCPTLLGKVISIKIGQTFCRVHQGTVSQKISPQNTMNTDLTEIAYILDRSGSMQHMQEAAISGFNQFVQEQLDEPGDANLTLALFDDEYLTPCERLPIQKVRPLDASTYVPRGCTALLDAIGKTIDDLGKRLGAESEDRRPGKIIVAIYTDGYENASQKFDIKAINKRITHQRKKYGWEFMFLAANQDAIATAGQMGIDANMASFSEASAHGVSSSSAVFARKVKSMRKHARTGEANADYLKSVDQLREEEESSDR